MKLFPAQALYLVALVRAQTNILLTNDDGWAVANIRAQNDALKSANLNVVLSCPAINKSGTGSSSSTPGPLTTPCEFNTCATGSPAEGFNASDPRLNYVNGFPVDSVRYGIQTLSPNFFSGSPDLVVSGPNVGSNLGSTVLVSGTVGAASEAALEGIPSIAFSGASGSQVSYTTLSDKTSSSSVAANVYAALTTKFVQALLNSTVTPILPQGVSINVNYPSVSGCSNVSQYKFVLSRITASSSSKDVQTCGQTHLSSESSVVATSGCFVSVSVFDASTKADSSATNQAFVLNKLNSTLPLSCI
ncbi:sure-like protein [Mycena floridula]|nr:sure-like protein [Mycena floridula]